MTRGKASHLEDERANARLSPGRLLANVVKGLRGYWHQREGDSFTRAYADCMAHRLPLLYVLIAVNTVLVAWRMKDAAPAWLVLFGPIALGSFVLQRARYWLPRKVAVRSLVAIRRDLRTMSVLGAAMAFAFALWVVLLYGHGDLAEQSFIHYMTAITLFSGILSLGHSPLTAVHVAAATIIPTSIRILMGGHPNAVLVIMVQVVITGLLLIITNSHHRDYILLELSRQELVRRERESARMAQDNLHQATIDPLTGALNRRAILARLEEEIALCDGGATPAWLALIDLDGFKHINDTYGHAAGDAVLGAVATRLESAPSVLSYGRLGGDEFAALLDPALDEEGVHALASDLSEMLRAPILHGGAVLRLSGSIGVHRVDGRSSSDCLERADAALYKAKEQSDGTVVVFSPEDEVALQDRAAITRTFNNCDLEQQIRLVYQPIIDAQSGDTTGFEAFARWSPDGEQWLAPGQFMPLAEATGRTGELTRMVMARALAECRAWESGRTVSINLAPRDVIRAGTAEALAELAQEAGAPPSSIILEVTESSLLRDPRRAEAQLRAFREYGFRIALDDFGAGWSSLSQVHSLPLDMIKIDQGLSRALATDPGARALVGTIVALSWQLGIDCTIEGVEDEAQAATARALGVRLMQGYHFGRPKPAADALAEAVRTTRTA